VLRLRPSTLAPAPSLLLQDEALRHQHYAAANPVDSLYAGVVGFDSAVDQVRRRTWWMIVDERDCEQGKR